MKLNKLSALLLAASTLAATSSAMAWESEDGQWSTSANVALGTDYVWRGKSQTDNEAAISGGFDLSHASGFYAGTWASNIDGSDDEGNTGTIEIDYYAGFSSDIGDSGFSYDVGALYYSYPDLEGWDFTELYGSISYSFLTAGIASVVDADDESLEDSLYYSLAASYDIGSISLAASVGYTEPDDGDEYTDYKIGASTELAGLGLDLSYTDTDIDNDNTADGRFIFTVSKSM